MSEKKKLPKMPLTGQGPAVPIKSKSIEKKRDKTGYTHPNLHRRIAKESADPKGADYELGIYGVDSYRTTRWNMHDEESTTSEIP